MDHFKKPTRKNDLDCRILTLGEVDDYSSNEIIGTIYEINELDVNKPIVKRQPIKLIINSGGGLTYCGLGIIDAIEVSTTPIHTICHGYAMSMALPILVMGKYRTISRRSTLMYHELNWAVEKDEFLKYHKQEILESERLQKIYDEILTSKTDLTQKQLKDIKDRSRDWYITPQEALDLKIVDKII
jgi:ATP-dependent Clp protease protease subunit